MGAFHSSEPHSLSERSVVRTATADDYVPARSAHPLLIGPGDFESALVGFGAAGDEVTTGQVSGGNLGELSLQAGL